MTIPLFEARVSAGFPSPAEGYRQRAIDLNELLIRNPSSTFMFVAEGESMIGAHIHDGDWVIVDRSLEAQDKDIVVAVVNGEFTVKTFRRRGKRVWLEPANPNFQPIEITVEMDAQVWGVVTGELRQFNRGHTKAHA